MQVVATAGHVDHGKSALVRALSGMEPDRWAEEKRRGLTIDLGFGWTTLPSSRVLGLVDVPGHSRFVTNALAGFGPAPAVMFVVAADEGWSQQSAEHLAALDALGVRHGLLVVSRCDLAKPGRAMEQSLRHIGTSSMGNVEAVAVSATTGEGVSELVAALDRLIGRMPAPDETARLRLWVDRAFVQRGSGLVVTGTLGAGTIRQNDQLQLGERSVYVRGLQVHGEPRDSAQGVTRVALNLRGTSLEEVSRGEALLTPSAWTSTTSLDARLDVDSAELPREVMLHIGSAAVPVRVRPMRGPFARLTLARALPLEIGDRALLRDPGRHAILTGIDVLDQDPPALSRRGAAAERATALQVRPPRADLVTELTRRGAMRLKDLHRLGVTVTEDTDRVRRVGQWVIAESTWGQWREDLLRQVDQHGQDAALAPAMPHEIARQRIGLPDLGLVLPLAESAGLESRHGRLSRPGTAPRLGVHEPAIAEIESRLRVDPFDVPTIPELEALRLGSRELAASAFNGRLIRLPDEVVLLPDGPARALEVVARLAQPFTLSEARQALGTTRRICVPLMEHLDLRGWTYRPDPQHRTVVPRPGKSEE